MANPLCLRSEIFPVPGTIGVQRRLTYINETEELLMKKLYKSNNRMICGVCAGLAEYLGIDPTVVRLIWAALGLTGTGILLYIIAALVMPENMDIL